MSASGRQITVDEAALSTTIPGTFLLLSSPAVNPVFQLADIVSLLGMQQQMVTLAAYNISGENFYACMLFTLEGQVMEGGVCVFAESGLIKKGTLFNGLI